MSSSDLLVRLLLNTDGFNRNLEGSKKNVNSFESDIKGMAGKAGVAIGKLAGAFGLAMGATEAFNKVIHSSQALGDEFDNSIAAAKNTVDAFFQSLSNGDWSAFNGGLSQTIANFKHLAVLRDGFADAQLSLGFETSQFEKDFSRLEGIIDDQTKSAQARKSAFMEMKGLIQTYQASVEGVSSGTETMLLKSLNSRFGQNFTIEDINKFISKYNYSTDFSNSPESKELADYMSRLSDLEGKQYKESVMHTPWGDITNRTEDKGVTADIEALKASNVELEKMRILTDDNDAARKKMIEDYTYLLGIQQKAAEFHKRSLEKQNTIMGLDASVGTAATPSASFPAPQVEAIKQSLADLASLPTPPVLEAIQRVGDGKQVSSIQDITNAVTSLSNVFNGEAANMVQYFANIVLGAAQAATAIAALIPMKKAEANANAEVAVTGAAASAASTPIVGWIMAASAVASVVAAMAAIPKFAHGGIVGGTSYSGDKVPAYLNSGEMVLNAGQQARLFALANGKGGNNLRGEVKLSGKDIYITLRNYMKSSGNRL